MGNSLTDSNNLVINSFFIVLSQNSHCEKQTKTLTLHYVYGFKHARCYLVIKRIEMTLFSGGVIVSFVR